MKFRFFLKWIVFLLVFFLITVKAKAFDPRSKIIQYEIPGRTASSVYSMKINGQPVFVEYYKTVPDAYEPGGKILQWQLENVSIVHFAFSGDAEIELTVNGTFTKYNLSPKRYNVSSTKTGNIISFSINKPMFLNFNTNNQLDEQIFIFADPIEEKPNLSLPNVLNIRNYPDIDTTGIAVCTGAIQKVINSLSSGDILYFPAGIYKTGHLNLKSNMTLYLAGGSVLLGTGSKKDYFLGSDPGTYSLLGIKDLTNVIIDGFGRVNLDGEHMRTRTDAQSSGGTIVKVLSMSGVNSNISVNNVFFMDSPKIIANIQGEYVNFYNVKLMGSQILENNDGLDPWRSKHVVIDKCFIYGRDDNVAIYGDDWGNNQYAVEDIVVRNCVMSSIESNNKIVIDEKAGTYVKNIVFENNDCLFGSHAIKISTDYSSDINNVWFRSINIERLKPSNYPWQGIQFRFEVKNGVNNNGNGSSGPIRNIHVQNLSSETGTKTDKPSFGVETALDSTSFIDSINFDNYMVAGKLITNINKSGYVKYQGVASKITNTSFNTDSTLQIVNITSNDVFLSKGSVGTFTISRNGLTTSPLTVEYYIKGTAINGFDYSIISDSIIIPAGETSANIFISSKEGGATESTEQVYLSLKSANDQRYMIGSYFLAMMNITNVTTGISVPQVGSVNIFPNPCAVGNLLRVTFNGFNAKVINMYDLNGKELLQKKLNGISDFSIDTYNLQRGIYIISSSTNFNQINKKVVIQ